MRMRLINFLRHCLACERGNTLVELGLAAPLLGALILGAMEYGWTAYEATSMENAARAGAAYATIKPDDDIGIKAAAKNATTIDPATLSVDTNRFCLCSGGAAITCGESCTAGGPPQTFITVRVSKTPPPEGVFIPPIFGDGSLMREATFRIK